MTREQFLQLAGQLYDSMSAPSGDGRSPKYDTWLPAGDGLVVYASECSAKELRYQKERSDKPPKDPKWLEANQKRSKALQYFIDWRTTNPTDAWRGERNHVTVTAALPSDRPEKYARDAAPVAAPEPAGGADMDDIPFSCIGDVG